MGGHGGSLGLQVGSSSAADTGRQVSLLPETPTTSAEVAGRPKFKAAMPFQGSGGQLQVRGGGGQIDGGAVNVTSGQALSGSSGHVEVETFASLIPASGEAGSGTTRRNHADDRRRHQRLIRLNHS